ncbi:MAG: hypothetical protein WA815_21270 [Terracidiphilus sp.]
MRVISIDSYGKPRPYGNIDYELFGHLFRGDATDALAILWGAIVPNLEHLLCLSTSRKLSEYFVVNSGKIANSRIDKRDQAKLPNRCQLGHVSVFRPFAGKIST